MAAGGVYYYPMMKMKRKELDDVSDDFSDFSLSSPARKIRRLDADLPPIMEEEEAVPSVAYDQSSVPMVDGQQYEGNQERAIVLFKPVNSQLSLSPSNFSVSVDSDIVSGFKNKFLWSSKSDGIELNEEGARTEDEKDKLAVVPWVPSQFPVLQDTDVSPTEVVELMEAEEMDVEDASSNSTERERVCEFSGIRESDGLLQWQQQHCMIPQLPQNTSTPITWFR